MAPTASGAESHQKRHGLLKDQVRLVKRRDSNHHEIAPIQDPLSFEKGFFVVIRACQLLAQKNDGIILVGLAGPSGAGKTIFTEKILNFLPSVAVISMDNYNDASRLVDGNFDDPRLTDYDTLLKNLHDLKEGKTVEVPIYDFKSSSRTGYRTLEVPSSGIVIIEGIYALSEKLRPLLDLRISVTGGVHFDLVKRVLRDIQRAGQEPEEIIQQISETVYPMYKAFIEPDLQTAHIKIINKFNPFTGFQNPTYILKSSRKVAVDQIKAVFEEHKETREQIYDIYLLPPGEDPESCQSYLRMRNKDGKYNLMFEEWVADPPFIISPRITFEVSVRLLSGLMALGYTIASIFKRSSHVFSDDRVCVKIDWLEQIERQYIQVQGKDRSIVKSVGEQLGLEGAYTPRTYIEQIQLEKLVNEVMALPDDLKTKLSLDEDLVLSPKEALLRASADRVAMRNKNIKGGISHSYSNQGDKNYPKLTGLSANNQRFNERNPESSAALASQGVITQLSEQISSLNDRMEVFTSSVEELNSKLTVKKDSTSCQNMALQSDMFNGSAPTSYFLSGLGNGSLTGSKIPNSSSSSQLAKESPLLDEQLSAITQSQRQMMHQLDSLSNLLRESWSHEGRTDRKKVVVEVKIITSHGIKKAKGASIHGYFRLYQSPTCRYITVNILLRLPLQEAIKTSILSKGWRYKWITIPHLVFSSSTFSAASKLDLLNRSDLLAIIHQVIFQHEGPISKFTLSSPQLGSCPEIDHLISFLSRKNIEEFTLCILQGNTHKIPSYLFSYLKMRLLCLVKCILQPPPHFAGFVNLKNLELTKDDLPASFAETFVAKCPLLGRLKLVRCTNLDGVDFYAPNLQILGYAGHISSVCFKNTPSLKRVHIELYGSPISLKSNTWIDTFCSLPSLEHLHIGCRFNLMLDAGIARDMLASHLNCLVTLVLYLSLGFTRSTLCLIKSSPNLQKLKLYFPLEEDDDDSAIQLSKLKETWDASLEKLQSIEISCFSGFRSDMAFIELLLAKSPMLETMHIFHLKGWSVDKKFSALQKINEVPRASPRAKVLFLEPT